LQAARAASLPTRLILHIWCLWSSLRCAVDRPSLHYKGARDLCIRRSGADRRSARGRGLRAEPAAGRALE
jgi:hypothetical protein